MRHSVFRMIAAAKKLANVEEVNKEETNCDMESSDGRQLRLVHNQVLLDMAKDIKPPPQEPANLKSEIKSPKGKGKPSKSKETSSYGPMPNFEREIQKIIAEQELVSQRSDQAGLSPDNSTSQTTSSLTQSSSPARKK